MAAHSRVPTRRGPSGADGTLTRDRWPLYFTNRIINEMVKYTMSADPLSAIFSALADPTRRAILARLSAGEATVTELAEPFAISLPAVSKHLKVLERAGLISRGREAQWRPCRLEAGTMKEAADWLDEYRRLWEGRLDRLDEYLAELQHEEP
jgi:DNA-binding transcriptional ArsR family regulator